MTRRKTPQESSKTTTGTPRPPEADEPLAHRGVGPMPWATLTLTTVTLVALVFGVWELIEYAFFTHLDPVRFHVLYLTRGIATSLILVAWAVWYVVRNRKAYEEDLKRSEEKYRGIVENSRDAISLVDPEGMVLEWNRRAEELYGYTREDVLGKPLPAGPQDHPDDYPDGQGVWKNLHDRAVQGWAVKDVEIRRTDKSGHPVDVLLSLTPLRDTTGEVKAVLVVERDVTQQKKMEREARHTERLASIGKMAAKVAHEIRNPLGAISLNVELLRDSGIQGPPKKIVGSIMKEITRLNEVVEDYLSFSRLPQPTLDRISVNDILQELLVFHKEETSQDGIRIVSRLDEDLPKIMGDRHQLHSVFLNIIKNAMDAMAVHTDGGELTIESGLSPENPGYLRVMIRDTGTGIPSGHIPRIFEPFFTTKPGGTGMGLAISRQIVQEHGGRLECESIVNSGTTFTVFLPVYWRKQ